MKPSLPPISAFLSLALAAAIVTATPSRADYILSPKSRSFHIDWNYGQNTPNGPYNVYFVFKTDGKSGDRIPVAQNLPKNRDGVDLEISRVQYLDLETKFRGKTAEIIVESAPEQKKIKLDDRIYIGGSSYDWTCKYPVLLTDKHGTIDRQKGDYGCIRSNIDKLYEQFPTLTTIVVSNGGENVKGELKSQNEDMSFGKNDQFIVLGTVKNGSAASSVEKSLRVSLALGDAGACVIGFVGDTPMNDGDAAKILNVPYFAVHQPASNIYKEVQVEDTGFNNFGNGRGGFEAIDDVGEESPSETPFSLTTSETGFAIKRGEKEKAPDATTVNPPKGESKPPVTEPTPQKRYRTEQRVVGTKWQPMDMSQYPVGSIDFENWCKLGPKLTEIIRGLQK